MKVLIVSTSLGAGHNGMAAELSHRLIDHGHSARTVDYLQLLPTGIGKAVASYYRAQLRYAPWSYEKSYAAFPRIHRQFAALNGIFANRGLRAALRDTQADIVVSNNPHASMALGYLKKHEQLSIPVTTYVTDFGVHPLWVHSSIDAHFVIHEQSQREAARLDAKNITVIAPLVGENFRRQVPSRSLRDWLGIDDESIAVLITAGSWGVGDLEETVDDVSRIPNTVPIVVCGNDIQLRNRLCRRLDCRTLGWVDNMAELMASTDVLVENAGGLTSLEALQIGLPVISYRPIPGHGRHNATSMAAVGMTTYARDSAGLKAAISSAKPAPLGTGLMERQDNAESLISLLATYAHRGTPQRLSPTT